jgi:hypothetical protein
MNRKRLIFRTQEFVHRLETRPGFLLFYGPLLLLMGIDSLSSPRDWLDHASSVALIVTGTSWVGFAIIGREGRRNWMRWGLIILTGLTASFLTVKAITLLYELFLPLFTREPLACAIVSF